jgi:hypothetical protein
MISRSKNGMMWELFNLVKCHVKELTIPLFYGMDDFSFMVAMTARRGSEICINAASKIKSTSGRKYRVTASSLLIGSGTQP